MHSSTRRFPPHPALLPPGGPAQPLPSLRAVAGLAPAGELLAGGLAVVAVCWAGWLAGSWMLLHEQLSPAGIALSSALELGVAVAGCVGGLMVGWLLPVARRPSARHAAVVAAFAVGFGFVRVAVDFAVASGLGLALSRFDKFLASQLPANILLTSTFAGLGIGLRALVARRDRAAAAARLEAELASARRRALHGRLQPEFLLAALDGISAGIPVDARAADRLLVRLSELLRLTLQRTRAELVPLAGELEYVSAFLEVEAGRSGRAVELRDAVPAGALGALVPPGSVSAFAEAALAAAPPGAPVVLTVRASVDAGRLGLRVADGVRAPVAERDRAAVEALARSLEESFGGARTLRYADLPGGGAQGVLDLPLRAHPPDAEGR